MKKFRNMERNFDGNKLDKISKILLDMGVEFQRETCLWNPNFKSRSCTRNPDFYIETEYGWFVLEVDGERVHGLFDISETAKTSARNADYIRAGIHFEVLNEAEAKHNNLSWESLVPYLVSKGIQYMRAKSLK